MKAKQAKSSKFESVKVGSVTVKVYSRTRPGGYRAFEVADYSSGVRRLRSFAYHRKAIAEADRIASLLSTGEAHAALVSGKDVASFGRALELLRPTGLPIEIAAGHFAEAFGILGGDRIVEAAKDFIRRNPTHREPRTVKQVAEELIALKTKRGKSARYLEDLRGRLSALASRFAVNVDSVTTADVQAWLDSMKAAPRTVKNCRANAGLLFKFAESRGYIARGENPVLATERITKGVGEAAATMFLRPGQTRDEYLTEFMNAYTRAKTPLDEPAVSIAWKRAQERPLPPEALEMFEDREPRLAVALCRELQTLAGDGPFFLSCRTVQSLFGHKVHVTGARLLKSFCGLEILKEVEAGNQRRASRYRYLLPITPPSPS